MAPLLKFCDNLEFFGFCKITDTHDFYFNLIYNTEIRHFAVEVEDRRHYDDTDTVDIILLLPKIEALELPSTGITDLTLSEVADENCMLRYLDISDCAYISDHGLTEILSNCSFLRHLNVQNTPTMKECTSALVFHEELRYVNALETLLSEENARCIREYFENSGRTYKFLYNTSRQTEHMDRFTVYESYDLLRLQESEEFDEIFEPDLFANDGTEASSSEMSLGEAPVVVLPDFDDLFNPELFAEDGVSVVSSATSSNSGYSSNEVEFTIDQYLHQLKEIADKPVLVPGSNPRNVRVVKSWDSSSSDWDYGSTDDDSSRSDIGSLVGSSRVGFRLLTTEAAVRSPPVDDADDEWKKNNEETISSDDDGWKQLNNVLNNIKDLKKDYKKLVQKVGHINDDGGVERPKPKKNRVDTNNYHILFDDEVFSS